MKVAGQRVLKEMTLLYIYRGAKLVLATFAVDSPFHPPLPPRCLGPTPGP